MNCAKIITIDGTQAVCLPKNCHFEESELNVNKIGKMLILTPKGDSWDSLMNGLKLFTEDFLTENIEDFPLQDLDPFYSDENQEVLARSIKQLENGHGSEHKLVDEDE